MTVQVVGDQPPLEYKPWGHLQGWPQWIRTWLLGEAPVFNIFEQLEKWDALEEETRTRVREDNQAQIDRRQATLARMHDLAKGCLGVLALLSAGVIFAFTQKPTGAAAILAVVAAGLNSVSVIILLRLIVPPPHTSFTRFEHPYEWVAPKRWTEHADEEFLAKDLSYLLELNHLAEFLKRGLVCAAVAAAVGQVVFLSFLIVHFL